MIMRNFTIMIMLIFLQHHLVASLSPINQKIALFRFKQSLTISTTPTNCSYYNSYYDFYYSSPSSHPKTMNWSMSSDYCTWEGVSCEHKTGNVIGLDLSCSQLEGAILPNSTLFQLSHLQFLNLSWNNFSLSNQFPQEFGFFAKGLTHLNLSDTQFSGRVPSGISHLYKLVSLDLSNYNHLTGQAKLEDQVFASLLQNLTQLRVLNLGSVDISSVLPVNLSTSLRVLDLGSTGLHGVLPQEVFHLPNLEVLDLSWNELRGVLPKVKWGSSGSLQHLRLRGGINLTGGIPDSIAFLESLDTLDLSYCNLYGPIPRSIGNLSQLTFLALESNNLSGPIPKGLANLRFLLLSVNYFTGPLPPRLFEHPSLERLALGYNRLTGQLYEFDSSKSNLKDFECENNLLSGPIPQSFSQLVNLTQMDFSSNNFNFSGIVTLPPNLIYLGLSSCKMKEFPHLSGNAEFIQYIDLSNNQIQGEIPHWIGLMRGGSYLNLSHNRLTGGLDQLPWNNIVDLDLHSNMLNGSLPTLICNSSSLETLNLSNNTISGVLPICRTNFTPPLSVFDLRMNNIQGSLPSTLSNFRNLESINLNGNKLEGRIPSSFAEFDQLETLDLGSNQINDTFPQCLEALPYLQVLVLRSNKFHGHINTSSKIEHPFPSLRMIDLSYNEFSGPLPAMYFKNFNTMMNGDVNKINPEQDFYSDSTALVNKGVAMERSRILTVYPTIDVSRNNFEGEIPNWIGSIEVSYLNLSHNRLTGGLDQLPWNNIVYLDLQSNMLNGSLPTLICNSSSLEILNLSNNTISGVLPICRTNLTPLSVFDLQMNNIQGSLPSTLSNFRNLTSINLHGNKLKGRIPSSFATFDHLEVLDLGSNQINDTFPQCLESLPNLQILVLKSNKFHGHINTSSRIKHPFPSLRIIDLSYNEFSGSLPAMYFKSFKAMMNGDANKIKPSYMGQDFYSDSTVLVIKGVEIVLTRILTVYTTIDLSRNNFEGEISEYIGNLVSLRFLNFSHNHLTGHIPSSIGKLSMLESLDLSFNRLEGEIPRQLTSIYSLARLNLSCNQLKGRIPEGWQFNTFDNNSYVGNFELCGNPLSKKCGNNIVTQEEEEDGKDDYFFSGFTWEAVVIGYGCGVVPAFIIGYSMLLAGKPKWFAGIIARELGLKIRRMEIRM